MIVSNRVQHWRRLKKIVVKEGTMAATTQNTRLEVKAPAAGQVVVLTAATGQDFILEAAFDQAEIRMDRGNVAFEFANGGRVVLDFTDLGDAEAPGIVMPDGTILNMQEFLAALGEGDIEPAAGPEGGADGSGGVGEYRDDAGNLIDGVNKLGVLDPREFTTISVESLDADVLAEDDAPVPPGPTPPTPPTPAVLGPVVTQVEESSLDETESQWPGSNESGNLDSTSGVIPFAPGSEGGDQLFILGVGDPVDVTTGGTVFGLYGTLVVTLNLDGTYNYTYTLNGNIDHPVSEENGGDDGRFDDDSLPDVFVMQVVNDGSIIATSSLTVNVLDDGPVIEIVAEPNLLLRTEDSYLPGGSSEQPTNTDTASAGAVFQVVFGADGPKLVPYNGEYSEGGDPSLQYSFGELDGVDSGLRDTLTGEPILLFTDENGNVIGRVASLGDEDATFILTMDESGLVTLTQYRPIMHDRPEAAVDGSDEVQFLTAEELVVNIRAIDGDDDSATESFSLAGLIAFGDDIVTAVDDTGRVSFGESNEIRFAISNVLFLVDVDGQQQAFKIDDYETLFNEMKDPDNPQGFVEWVEAQTGGTVTAYYIKAGQLFYDSDGNVIDPESIGLGDYLTGNGNTFGGSNVAILEPSTDNFDPDAVGSGFEGSDSGNVLMNDIGSADGIWVSGVSNDGGETWLEISQDSAVTIEGAYGTLTLYANGDYDYALNDSGQYGPQDVFFYQVEDGDGDQDSAMLTIDIALETMLASSIEVA
jgi:VCBS repeat-containing protein